MLQKLKELVGLDSPNVAPSEGELLTWLKQTEQQARQSGDNETAERLKAHRHAIVLGGQTNAAA